VFINGLPLSFEEAQEVVVELRTPRTGEGHSVVLSNDAAAAVHIERLMEDFPTENPPMNDSEAVAVLLALARLIVSAGLSDRQQAVHASLFKRYEQL